jgi:hypothetical protein
MTRGESDGVTRRETRKLSNTYLRTAITAGAFIVAFLLGYSISARTGIEPGYFGAVETGAYGTLEASDQVEGLSIEDAYYYKSLSEE